MNKTTLTVEQEVLCNDHDFLSEKEMKNYIIENKESFCLDILGVKYKSHIVESSIPKLKGLTENAIVIDIVFIDTKGGRHFIELKHPKFGYNELMQGIGQCLSYRFMGMALNINLMSVCLVTSKHNNYAPLVIRDNNLPIKYVYLDKNKHAIARL